MEVRKAARAGSDPALADNNCLLLECFVAGSLDREAGCSIDGRDLVEILLKDS